MVLMVPLSIRPAAPDELVLVRMLFCEYANALDIDLSFQDFATELAELPWEYVELLVARRDAEPVGCVALRLIDAETCEMKRLYVRPAARGAGAGRALVEAVVERAAARGFRRMRLDTLPSMRPARELYRAFGFREIEPYRFNPVAGSSFMELEL